MFRRIIAEKKAHKLIGKEWESDFMKDANEKAFKTHLTEMLISSFATMKEPGMEMEIGGIRLK